MTGSKQRKWRLITRLHRWAGLVLGIQVTLWFASGLFMTLPPIDRVRGTHMLADAPEPPALPASAVASAIANYGADVSEVRSFSVGPRALVRLDGANGPTFYGPDAFAPLRRFAEPVVFGITGLELMGWGFVLWLAVVFWRRIRK